MHHAALAHLRLFAVERLEMEWLEPFRQFTGCLNWFLENRLELVEHVVHQAPQPNGKVTLVLTNRDADYVSWRSTHC